MQLARRYGVGRVAAWEAIRILEARGTARMRCGKGGGLELTGPSVERLCERIVGYCLLSGVTYDQVRVFMEMLQHVRLRRTSEGVAPNAVIALYEECIKQLNQVSETEVRNGKPRNSADLIVNDLFQRIGVARWSEGLFLGNQTELCGRYKVDSRTLRQAIRILESADAAVTVPGRGHGLMARAPGPASTSRLICCYFAASGIDHHEAFQAFNWLSTEAMSLAASRSIEQSLDPIGAMLAEFGGLADMAMMQALMSIEDRQLALAGNVVLDLFLRSCKAFPVWRPFSYRALEPMVDDLFNCAVAVQTALTVNDATAAALAQTRKFTIIDHNLRSHVPEYSQRFRTRELVGSSER
jgi:DNA-binding FadR family transcriptional regulator